MGILTNPSLKSIIIAMKYITENLKSIKEQTLQISLINEVSIQMFEKRISQYLSSFCWILLYELSNFQPVTYILDITEYVCLFVWIHDIFLICQLSNVFRVPKRIEEYFWSCFWLGINNYIKNRYSVMTQQMPPYFDIEYPP